MKKKRIDKIKNNILLLCCGVIPEIGEAPFIKDGVRFSKWIITCRHCECGFKSGEPSNSTTKAYDSAIENWNNAIMYDRERTEKQLR